MRYIQEYDFESKKALIRVDFNVPLDDQGEVVDSSRIQAALPTILQVLNRGGAVVLLSHLGRPQKGYEQRLSLQNLVAPLSQSLGVSVKFAPSCVGPDVQARVQRLVPGEVLLLENVRFQKGETQGNSNLALALAAWGDVYINDAFGTAHRAHASTAVLAQYFSDRLMGYLMQAELQNADKILQRTNRPLVAIVGGAKVSDKIQPLERLLDRFDIVLLGGGVATTFQKAQEGKIESSGMGNDEVEHARQLLHQAQQKGTRLVLPADVVVAPCMRKKAKRQVVAGEAVPPGWLAIDIGPKAQQEFAAIVQAAKTILWCGPVGVFEVEGTQQGTLTLAEAVAQATRRGAFSLVGGGDSTAAIRRWGYANQVSYLSTGGSALLAYLGGVSLPGVQALA